MHTIGKVLKTYYGYEEFRPGQEEIIKAILKHQDVLGIMPTGGGKSLCYQIPAIVLSGTALVISPLISLMKDQVDGLRVMGVRAAYMNSQMTPPEYQKTMDDLLNGNLDLLYIAPERLDNDSFLHILQQIEISMVAVDEAHCISQWGQDFRPSYQNILQLRDYLNDSIPFVAFTATATNRVKEDIIHQLRLRHPYLYTASFDRPNLYFSVIETKKKSKELLPLIGKDGSTIIYCNTRKNVEAVYKSLTKKGFPVVRYHGGLSSDERNKNQEDFTYDKKTVMVATNAFGMGIDKPDVRKVIHYNMPLDVESYYQEAGRAGRDGAPAEAILLYSAQDIITNTFLIEQGNQEHATDRLKRMISYCKTGQCLREFLLNYFDEYPSWKKCEHCSNCDGHTETYDITVGCQKILSCIFRMDQRFGTGLITDVLKGKNTERIRSMRFDELSTYGLMSDSSDGDIKDMISLMLGEGYLALSGDSYPIIKFTPKTSELLKGEVQLKMTKKIVEDIPEEKKKSAEIEDYDKNLFEELRSLRTKIAKEIGKPPFVVFADRSLMDMAAKIPVTSQAFLGIHGVGQTKLETYGDDFISVIQSYKEKNSTVTK